jgi:prepilin peptidase CpaA
MSGPLGVIAAAFLIPLALIIAYYDVCYRRIPNSFVLATLIVGVIVNASFGGVKGALASIGGCVLAFALMFALHVFSAMGAGDVKLFAAIGAVMGAQLVLPTFLMVALTGGVLGIISTVYAGQLKPTMMRVFQILVGLLPGNTVPRFPVPADRRHTIPYGVAITLGSLISVVIFRA